MPELNWAKDIFSKDKKDNAIWENWTKPSFRSSAELAEIVYGTYQKEFQKRALFLLLVPDTRLAPFHWLPPNFTLGCVHNYLNHEVDFKKVEIGLRAYAVYWLTKFIEYSKYQIHHYDHRIFWLDAYNKYIFQLLAILPAEDNEAEDLFSYFSINESVVIGENGSSRYNPLILLWKNPQINEKWKRMADLEIRSVIKNELRGDSTPREPHEEALHCYTKHLQSLLSRDHSHLPYSKEFLAEQLDFLTSLEVSDQYLIQPESVALILNLLMDKKYENIRGRFIRFAVLRDGNFKIYSDQTVEAAQLILLEKNGDRQVTTIITDILNSYLSEKLNQKQKAEEKERAKELLLAPMRKITPGYPEE